MTTRGSSEPSKKESDVAGRRQSEEELERGYEALAASWDEEDEAFAKLSLEEAVKAIRAEEAEASGKGPS